MTTTHYVVFAAVGIVLAFVVRWWWIGPILKRLDEQTERLDAQLRETRRTRAPTSAEWRCPGCPHKGAAGEYECRWCGALAP